METKQVKIHLSTHLAINEIKIHKRETFDDVIIRLINFYKKNKQE